MDFKFLKVELKSNRLNKIETVMESLNQIILSKNRKDQIVSFSMYSIQLYQQRQWFYQGNYIIPLILMTILF